MRAAMNAILYLLRTGCPWRYLPRDGFPPHSTVYNIFRKFQREGTWEAIWAELHMALRERMGPRGQLVGAVKTTKWVLRRQETKLGNHRFRAAGITAYIKNGGTLEKAAAMANHASTRTTQLYDRQRDQVSIDEVERIVI
jgi:transposase